MRRIISLCMALTLVLSFAFMGSGLHSAAAGSAKDVWVGSFDGNAPVSGACLRLVPYSNLGCDRDGDGFVWFKAIPLGTFTITYTSVPDGFELPVSRTLRVTRTASSVITVHVPLEVTATGSADVSIQPFDEATGDLLPGACFTLRGYSNMGCDENRDGQVEFADIPFGTYTIDIDRAPAGTTLANTGWDDLLLVVDQYSGAHTVRPIAFSYDS